MNKFDNAFQDSYDRRRQRDREWANSTEGQIWTWVVKIFLIALLAGSLTLGYVYLLKDSTRPYNFRPGSGGGRIHRQGLTLEQADEVLEHSILPVAVISLLISTGLVLSGAHVKAFKALGMVDDRAP